VVVGYVDIGRIVDHHCLSVLISASVDIHCLYRSYPTKICHIFPIWSFPKINNIFGCL
jgi:hypothetical protein